MKIYFEHDEDSPYFEFLFPFKTEPEIENQDIFDLTLEVHTTLHESCDDFLSSAALTGTGCAS